MHEFADVRVYGGENAPNIFAVLDVSSLTIEWKDFLKFFTLIIIKVIITTDSRDSGRLFCKIDVDEMT